MKKRLAWSLLALNLFIILWGAWVRISGSGAGCGDHWPLCNGQVMPLSPSLKTLTEFTHRFTSGLDLILGVALLWVLKKDPHTSPKERRYSKQFFGFLLVEALLGALLVKLGLVDQDASLWRGWVLCVHLINTLLLMRALALFVWHLEVPQPPSSPMGSRRETIWEGGLSFLFGLTVMSGGIAALGNTLFPSQSLKSGFLADFEKSSHLFLRLRIYHPVFAILLCLAVVGFVWKKNHLTSGVSLEPAGPWSSLKSWTPPYTASLLVGLIAIQIIAGFANLALLAPAWLQITHLALMNGIWVVWNWYLVQLNKETRFDGPNPK
jgi:heme A synthase